MKDVCLLTRFEQAFGRMPISADEFVSFCKSISWKTSTQK
jgi:hypothetical protein